MNNLAKYKQVLIMYAEKTQIQAMENTTEYAPLKFYYNFMKKHKYTYQYY